MNAATKTLVWAACSFAAGYAYWLLLTLFWAYWALHNPLLPVLISPGHVNAHYRWVLYPTDFATSVLVSLPFALALIAVARSRLWLCTAAASVACLVTVEWSGLASVPPGLALALLGGLLLQLVVLPASVAVALALRRWAPNNSSKPTPLRGAA